MNQRSGLAKISASYYLAIVVATVIFSLLCITTLLGFLYYEGSLAPPPLTGNISFDLKAEILREKDPTSCKVLAVGSSMTLNNLDSNVIVRSLGVEGQFLNVGAWGRRIGQTRAFLEVLLEKYHPQLVIMVTTATDFVDIGKDEDFDRIHLSRFIQGSPYWLTAAKYFSLSHYRYYRGEMLQSKHRNDIFNSLQFDPHGGVSLNVTRDSDPRWERRRNEAHGLGARSPRQYQQLIVIANLLRERGIEFVVAQAPIRTEAFERKKETITQHWQQLNQIASTNQIRFVNLHNQLTLQEDCFGDGTHLNSKGARRFTTALVDHIQQENPSFRAGCRINHFYDC